MAWDTTFNWNRSRYSVPWPYAGQQVLVRELETGELVVEVGGQVIARHKVAKKQLCEHYDRGLSMIITSNVSYGEWNRLMGDPVLATAMLDRLLHRAVTINIRDPSYRLKDRLRSGYPCRQAASRPIR